MTQELINDFRLSSIISYLLVNYGQVHNIGLMSGKMGGVLLFMALARKTGMSAYSDFCDELLDDVYNQMHSGMPIGLFEGLTGIGWGIEFLVKNKLAEGNTDELLKDIDSFVMEHDPRRMSDTSLESGLGGVLFYVCARLGSQQRRLSESPFDQSYICGLSEAIHSLSFEQNAILLGMVKDFDVISCGHVGANNQIPFPDFMLEGVPSTIDNPESLPIGIRGGLTGYVLQKILR